MTRIGASFPRSPLEPRTYGAACGLWPDGVPERADLLPTPVADGDRARDYDQGGRSLGAEARRRDQLAPTPVVKGNYNHPGASKHAGTGLIPWVMGREGEAVPAPAEVFWTPTATDYKGSSQPGQRRNQLSEIAVGLWLRPGWVEWLMGAPEGWTDLAPLPAAALERWEELVASGCWWSREPLPRTIPRQSVERYGHRLAQLGNGQVPLCASVAFEALRACPLDAPPRGGDTAPAQPPAAPSQTALFGEDLGALHLTQLRKRYAATTGRKPGNRTRQTMLRALEGGA
jgi:hypothetical protein